MNELIDYEVTQARFIAGQHRKIGDPVRMTERAAKYYIAPYGSGLKLAAPARAQPAAKADATPAQKQAKTAS
jgi:hypothetical protein